MQIDIYCKLAKHTRNRSARDKISSIWILLGMWLVSANNICHVRMIIAKEQLAENSGCWWTPSPSPTVSIRLCFTFVGGDKCVAVQKRLHEPVLRMQCVNPGSVYADESTQMVTRVLQQNLTCVCIWQWSAIRSSQLDGVDRWARCTPLPEIFRRQAAYQSNMWRRIPRKAVCFCAQEILDILHP